MTGLLNHGKELPNINLGHGISRRVSVVGWRFVFKSGFGVRWGEVPPQPLREEPHNIAGAPLPVDYPVQPKRADAPIVQ